MIDVMIIDDDIAIRQRLKSMIPWEELNLRLVCEAADSDSARELCLLHCPKIVITDICIPVISGLDLAEELSREDPDIRFIVITGFTDFEYVQKSVRINAVDLLSKPVRPDELIKSIQKAIQYFDNKKQRFEHNVLHMEKEDHLHVLKCAFTKELLNDATIDQISISRKAASLGVNLSGSYLSAAVISLSNNHPVAPGTMNAFIGIVEKSFGEEGIRVYHYLDKQNAHCLLIAPTKESSSRSEDLINQVREHLRLVTPCNVSAGIGQTVSAVSLLPQSHVEAQIALNHQQFFSDIEVFHYQNIRHYEVRFSTEEELLEYLVVQFNENHLEQLSAALENHIYSLSAHSVDGLQNISTFCIRYLLSIIRAGLTLGLDMNQIDTCGANLALLAKISAPLDQLNYVLAATKQLLSILFSDQHQSTNHLITLAKQYIVDNLGDNNLNLDQVSNYVGLSRIYFCKLFHKEEGISFNNYLIAARIARAKELLLQPNWKVFEISDTVGFSSAKYFGQVFKREVGVTPLEYQKGNTTNGTTKANKP